MSRKNIIAVGLLSQDDLDRLGERFTRLWPVQDTPCFEGLLVAIDEADREYRRARDEESSRRAAADMPIMRLGPVR